MLGFRTGLEFHRVTGRRTLLRMLVPTAALCSGLSESALMVTVAGVEITPCSLFRRYYSYSCQYVIDGFDS
jgi:hypothetical protein